MTQPLPSAFFDGFQKLTSEIKRILLTQWEINIHKGDDFLSINTLAPKQVTGNRIHYEKSIFRIIDK